MYLKLKEARLAAGLSIEDIAATLNIKKQYVMALEEGDLQVIPGKVYADGYLKLYSNYLGIDIQSSSKKTKVVPKQVKVQVGRNFKKYFIIFCALMLAITIIAYNQLLKREAGANSWSQIESTGFSNAR